MTKLLDRLFPRPSPRPREKPEEVSYGIDERPPPGVLLSAAIQHVLLGLMFSVYAVLAGQGIGLQGAEVAQYLGSCLFIYGLGTILMASRSRFTPGLLFVFMPNYITLGTYVAVVAQYGIGAAMGAILVSHIAIIFLARFLPRLRPLFPPEVVGVLVLMLGVSLIAGGIGRSVGFVPDGRLSPGSLSVAAVTIVCIVAFSVWGTARLRTVAVLIGIGAGLLAAFAMGVANTSSLADVGALPLLALPFLALSLPMPEFVPAAIAVIFLVELFTAIDQFACGLTMDKLNDAKWRRADMPLVSRAVIGSSLTNLMHGVSGTLTSGFSSANIGLAYSTGVMSRYVGLAAGGILCTLGFLPAIPAMIVLIPAPVIGAMLVYTAAFMIVAGMDLILSRLLNTKRTFTVGLSIVAGMAVMLLPEMVEGAPEWSRTIVESGLTVGALSAVLLNAIFRIGIKQQDQIHLPGSDGGKAAADFLEHNGKIWGARKDVIMRAGIAVGEALEAIAETGVAEGPVTLTASFDEFNLLCRLTYPGHALELAVAEPLDAAAIFADDDDAALDAAMMRVSSVMVARIADEVKTFERDGRAELRLRFDH